ncbi:DMT family transporter [Paracoccus sp. p4-l81]|uniref:aromatic amino acid exporter YddG n=1 Tax=unclassified Paracoccus (in: a-proteobacteria) TaxID=2688777 RepID=UPI0035B8595B
MSRTTATLIGFTAILMWSALAVLTVATTPVPPFLLNALTFAIGGGLGLVWAAARGQIGALRRVPLRVYAMGTAAMFGYHALYFSALRLAPPAQASLICFLWPLLIVLGSGLMPGERLRAGHVIGAIIAFAGAAAILGGGGALQSGAMLGYGLAFCCALIWAAYSLGSRRGAHVPTAAVAVFCLATALLSALIHPLVEVTAWPRDPLGWGAVAALGAGPVGLAFFTWDIGVKRGDIQVLGTASYAAPVLSTLILIATGASQAGAGVIAAAAMIATGALLAARAGRSRPE